MILKLCGADFQIGWRATAATAAIVVATAGGIIPFATRCMAALPGQLAWSATGEYPFQVVDLDGVDSVHWLTSRT